MDLPLIREHLAQAERYAPLSGTHVARQIEIIDGPECGGRALPRNAEVCAWFEPFAPTQEAAIPLRQTSHARQYCVSFPRHPAACGYDREVPLAHAFALSELPLVLVVEDEYSLQGLVEDALSDGGFAADILCLGEEALMLFVGGVKRYRALVADVSLKGRLSGWNVASRIRDKDPAFPCCLHDERRR
ncbi:response regulator [Bradyrhizobium sp. ARR65]|uniref:response regulator n=1 Tax=Bradyrhizobium sp. ARR65 TaxID=1040989 RepID=UPI0007C4A4A1